MADGTLFLAPQEIPEETLVLMADIVRFSLTRHISIFETIIS